MSCTGISKSGFIHVSSLPSSAPFHYTAHHLGSHPESHISSDVHFPAFSFQKILKPAEPISVNQDVLSHCINPSIWLTSKSATSTCFLLLIFPLTCAFVSYPKSRLVTWKDSAKPPRWTERDGEASKAMHRPDPSLYFFRIHPI